MPKVKTAKIQKPDIEVSKKVAKAFEKLEKSTQDIIDRITKGLPPKNAHALLYIADLYGIQCVLAAYKAKNYKKTVQLIEVLYSMPTEILNWAESISRINL